MLENPFPRPTIVTTEAKALNSTVTTETTVSVKGDKFLKVEDAYRQFPDLVNEQYRVWYYGRFNALGLDMVYRMAAIARQEAHTDRRHMFSSMLKRGTLK